MGPEPELRPPEMNLRRLFATDGAGAAWKYVAQSRGRFNITDLKPESEPSKKYLATQPWARYYDIMTKISQTYFSHSVE